MQRIMILGPPGAGKSTLARAIGKRLNLPVIHLDQIFWQPGWKRPDWETFRAQVAEAAAGEQWVMDGNYFDTYDLRVPRADTIIHIEVPTIVSLYRILRRAIADHGQVRFDGPEGCPEQIDFPFIWFALTFRRVRRPKTMAVLEENRDRLNVIRLTDSKSVDRFLHELDAPA